MDPRVGRRGQSSSRARRLALAGFVAFASDALCPLGGWPGTEDKARERSPQLGHATVPEHFVVAVRIRAARPECSGKVGAVGFCDGGGMVNYLATRHGDALSAGIAFHGSAPSVADAPKVRAPLMLQSAEVDERIKASWPAFGAALKVATVTYERHLHPGTQHGFHNDTTPRYDAAAARKAWERTVESFCDARAVAGATVPRLRRRSPRPRAVPTAPATPSPPRWRRGRARTTR